ncbi:MAG: ABC transporter permease subunit, partial [Sphaerochaetaceae bacterium]
PLIKPVLFVAVTFRMIHAFKGFDLIYVLTGGGPGYATEIINTYIQKVFMQQRRMGYGSAISLITIILVLILFFTFNRFMERRNEK